MLHRYVPVTVVTAVDNDMQTDRAKNVHHCNTLTVVPLGAPCPGRSSTPFLTSLAPLAYCAIVTSAVSEGGFEAPLQLQR